MQSVTETGLRRSVGVTGLFLYGLGNTIGAGIFVLVGKIAGVAGLQAPLAILLTLLATLVIYVLVALTAVLNLPPAELAASAAPLALIYESATGHEPWLISFISLVAVVNGALVQMIMASRMLFGIARLGWLWHGLAHIHPRRRTPDIATLVVVSLVAGFTLWLPLEVLAKLTSFIVLLVFTLMNLALLRIHRRQAPAAGVTALPDWMPLTGALVSLGFLLYSPWQFLRPV